MRQNGQHKGPGQDKMIKLPGILPAKITSYMKSFQHKNA